MELGTLIGFFGGLVIIILSLLISAEWIVSDLITFWNAPSVLITVGGAVAATFIGNRFNTIITAFKATGLVFKPPVLDPAGAIDQIVVLANTARKEGVLALEDSAESMGDQFLKKGIMLIVDGTDPELVKGIMETELSYIDERHSDVAAVFEFLASQGPAWGMIGTLIGLILMLLKMDDPSALGPAMAVALITTFYGSLLANFFCTPFATKMKTISKEEVLLKTVLIEGMLSIQAGENPRIIEEKLKSFLSPAIRDSVGSEDKKRESEE